MSTTYTAEQVAAAVARSKEEILADVRDGTTPADVTDFGSLHDYTDANCYGGLCDDWTEAFDDDDAGNDAWMAFGNAVQDRVHRWLEAGGIREALGAAEADRLLALHGDEQRAHVAARYGRLA